MSFVSIGSKEYNARNELSALNAYMFWTKTDCRKMTPAEALKKIPRKLWWDDNASFISWCKSFILSQDVDGLDAMRSEYTKKTKKDWKTASLGDVMKTLGHCKDLYQRGEIIIDGIPNTRAELIKIGIDVKQGKAKEVVETIENSSYSRIQYPR